MKSLLSLVSLLCLTVSALAVPPMRHQKPVVKPLDWSKATALSKDVRLTAAGEGRWQWVLPANQTSAKIAFDLDALGIDPRDYDVVQLRFRCQKSLVMFGLEIQNHPADDLHRNWYSKVPMEANAWNDWRVDLLLDDDSQQQQHRVYQPGRRLVLTLYKRYLRTPGEPAERILDLEACAFLRHPVKVDFEETEATLQQDAERISWTYYLTVQNTESVKNTVTLALKDSQLKHFRPSWERQELTLAPRENRRLALSMTALKSQLGAVPSLYSESVEVSLRSHGHPGTPEIFPLIGYRPRKLWAVVPPERSVDFYVRPKESRDRLMSRADKALKSKWGIPEYGPSGHDQSYIDTSSNSRLRALSWFRHESVKSKKVLENDAAVTMAYVSHLHQANFRRALVLGQAWRETGEAAYAEAARDVLLEYARVYPTLIMTSQGATGYRTRLSSSTLLTAFWFADVLSAYAAVKDSPVMGPADRELIENSLILPELRGFYGHNVEYTNMQVHHYHIYSLCVAVLNRHWNLLGEALYGGHGFHATVDRSFSEDGMSQEGKVYHIFTLMPLLNFVNDMGRLGLNIVTKRFKRIFDGVVLNTPQGIAEDGEMAKCVREGWKVFHDPLYLPTMRAYGWTQDSGGQLLTESTLMPNNGFVWLREASPWGFRAAKMNYIMNLDRSEYDRLQVTFYDPKPLNSEVRRISYGSPQAKVMAQTVSHNTVTVDRKNQADVAAALGCFLKRAKMPAAMVVEDGRSPLYAGVRFTRVMALFDGLMFIGDLQDSAASHTYDWPFYGLWEPWAHADTGRFQVPLQLKSSDIGYDFMTEAKTAQVPTEGVAVTVGASAMPFASNRIDRSAPNRWLRLVAAPQSGMSVWTACTPRGHMPEPGPLMMLRQQGRQADFGVAFEVLPASTSRPRIQKVESVWRDGVSGAWLVTADSGRYLVVANRTGKAQGILGKTFSEKLEVIRL